MLTKKRVMMAGYGAAVAGGLMYFITGSKAGMILGGVFLCATSMYKVIVDKRDRN